MSSLAISAGVSPPGRSSLGRLLLIPLGCLVLAQAGLALSGVLPVLDGALGDTDAYMRLNRVVALHESGSWFDSRFARINPPDGHVQHWTRPLDALLLAGAWLLAPFLGFARALHVWGVLLSPLLLGLTVVALAWAAEPVLDRDTRVIACLALLLQPTVLAYASLGRPDHHSLLFLLFVLLLGLTFRLLAGPAPPRLAAAAGLLAALAVWVSPEALAFVAPSLAVLGCCWLLGDDAMAAAVRRYLSWLTLGLGAALLVERGPGGLWALENDRLSVLHVALSGALALAWPLVTALTRRQARRLAATGPARPCGAGPAGDADACRAVATRAGAAALGLLAVASLMLLLFPELRAGPLGQVDPLYARLRLQHIAEIQPLVPAGALAAGDLSGTMHRLVGYLGIAMPALGFLVLLLVRERGARRRIWAGLALVLAIFLPLTFYQIRWGAYAQLLLLLPYSALLVWFGRRLAEHVGAHAAAVCRPALLALGLLWPLLLLQVLPPARAGADGCPIGPVAPALERAAGGASRTIMANPDYGPEILYRTRHSVLSIPNHRPQPGFAATHRTLSATDEHVARAELARFGVDWILLCPSAAERTMFAPSGAQPPTLYRRLVEGDAPPWLRPLPLEAAAGGAQLFEVVRESGSGPASSGAAR